MKIFVGKRVSVFGIERVITEIGKDIIWVECNIYGIEGWPSLLMKCRLDEIKELNLKQKLDGLLNDSEVQN